MAVHALSFRGIKVGILSLAALSLCSASFAHAQDEDMSDEDADHMMTVAIGCVAAYDLVLARGQGGAKAKEIKRSRAEAREIYQQLGDLSDSETDQDIAKSEAVFPAILDQGTTTLKDIERTCDELLSTHLEVPAATTT